MVSEKKGKRLPRRPVEPDVTTTTTTIKTRSLIHRRSQTTPLWSLTETEKRSNYSFFFYEDLCFPPICLGSLTFHSPLCWWVFLILAQIASQQSVVMLSTFFLCFLRRSVRLSLPCPRTRSYFEHDGWGDRDKHPVIFVCQQNGYQSTMTAILRQPRQLGHVCGEMPKGKKTADISELAKRDRLDTLSSRSSSQLKVSKHGA